MKKILKKLVAGLMTVTAVSLCVFTNNAFAINDEEEAQASGIINMTGEFLDGDILKISVSAQDMMTPILGFAFHFTYEKEKVAFLKYEPGEFLENGGDPFYLVQNKENSGEIIFGETLRRDDDFPQGNGIIADFYFQILDNSDDLVYAFTFSNGVVSTLDTVRQDLSDIEWKNLDLKRSDVSETIYPSVPSGESNSFLISLFHLGTSPIFPIFLIVAALVTAAGLISFIQKKRHRAFVNFK